MNKKHICFEIWLKVNRTDLYWFDLKEVSKNLHFEFPYEKNYKFTLKMISKSSGFIVLFAYVFDPPILVIWTREHLLRKCNWRGWAYVPGEGDTGLREQLLAKLSRRKVKREYT